jgi:predicted esterase
MSTLAVIFFVSACKDSKKKDDLPKYLVEATPAGTLTPAQIHQAYNNEPAVVFLAYQEVESYRVTYRTTTPSGTETLASGLVLVPSIPGASLFSIHRGTTFFSGDVPSQFNPAQIGSNAAWVYFGPVLASNGNVVMMPDLLGYGASASMKHPFFVTSSDGQVSLDLMRATQELLEQKDYPTNGKLKITGYSQGGTTTLALIRAIQETASEEFTVTAATAGGGAYNLVDLAKAVLSKDDLGFAPYFALLITSYIEYYFPDRALNTIINEPYASRIISENLFSGNHGSSHIMSRLNNETEAFINSDFRAAFLGDGEVSLKQRLQQNDMTNFAIMNPIRIYHGKDDEVLPIDEARTSAQLLKDAGSSNLNFFELNGSHAGAAIPFGQASISWLSNY